MNTSVRTKFAALALALCANSALLGGITILFQTRPLRSPPIAAANPVPAAPVA